MPMFSDRKCLPSTSKTIHNYSKSKRVSHIACPNHHRFSFVYKEVFQVILKKIYEKEIGRKVLSCDSYTREIGI